MTFPPCVLIGGCYILSVFVSSGSSGGMECMVRRVNCNLDIGVGSRA